MPCLEYIITLFTLCDIDRRLQENRFLLLRYLLSMLQCIKSTLGFVSTVCERGLKWQLPLNRKYNRNN